MLASENIFIVSNRMPLTITKTQETVVIKRSSGGLVAALAPVHAVARSWWVGSLGDKVEDDPEVAQVLEDQKYLPVDIPRDLYTAYYNGLCNGAIWPLFHYFITHTEFREPEWEAYREVNRIFCDTIASRLAPNDTVWVQDYQLMLLPAMLRRKRKDIRIGYFHHIPFPASEVFRVFPWRIEVLEGLLGADVVGFHTLEYARHFVSSVSRLIGYENVGEEIYRGERLIKVGAFPLGVDVDSLAEAAQSEEHATRLDELFKSFADKKLILGVDRLDYTKGIKERLLAYELFLRRNPEYQGRTVFLQLCVPSRVEVPWYIELKNEIERLVGRINGEFSTITHSPVQYLFQSVALAELTALYKRADVCLVTPLRDGLNLVCKEYVEARDDLDGVLVLSEFAGAAEEMGEALLVNPYDISATASSLESALEMSAEERRERMSVLRARVHDFDNKLWADSFLEILAESVDRNQGNVSRELNVDEWQHIARRILTSDRIVVCFDYDATFAMNVRRPDFAAPANNTMQLLSGLARSQRFVVCLVTHRSRDFCSRSFNSLGLWMAAESGAFVFDPNEQVWLAHTPLDAFEKASVDVTRILERCVRRVPGSRVDVYEASVVWNYSQARSTFAQSLALETAHSLNQMLHQTQLQCSVGRKTLEIRFSGINKASALDVLTNRLQFSDNDLILTFGDNKTGDDMYRLCEEQNVSITVGALPSVSSHLRLRGYPEFENIVKSMIHVAANRVATQVKSAVSRSDGSRSDGSRSDGSDSQHPA